MFKTMKERRAFIDNYKDWGKFLVIPELKLVIYKAKLSTGAEIYATEYGYKNYEGEICRNVICSLVLTEGDSFPSSKYYSHFSPTGCGITTLMNYLKAHPEATVMKSPKSFDVVRSRGFLLGSVHFGNSKLTEEALAESKGIVLDELYEGILNIAKEYPDEFFIVNYHDDHDLVSPQYYSVGAKIAIPTVLSKQYDIVRCGECEFCNGISCEHEFGLNGAVQSDDFCPYGKRKVLSDAVKEE